MVLKRAWNERLSGRFHSSHAVCLCDSLLLCCDLTVCFCCCCCIAEQDWIRVKRELPVEQPTLARSFSLARSQPAIFPANCRFIPAPTYIQDQTNEDTLTCDIAPPGVSIPIQNCACLLKEEQRETRRPRRPGGASTSSPFSSFQKLEKILVSWNGNSTHKVPPSPANLQLLS